MFSNPWMLGILKWGMAQIWSCGWALRKYKVKKSTFIANTELKRAHLSQMQSKKIGYLFIL